MSEQYGLRAHHIISLINGHDDGYIILEDGVRKCETEVDGIDRSIFTERDAVISREFYSSIAANPENTVVLVEGIDDKCKLCSNYDGSQCTTHTAEQLRFEDQRTLGSRLPQLIVGKPIRVAELIP